MKSSHLRAFSLLFALIFLMAFVVSSLAAENKEIETVASSDISMTDAVKQAQRQAVEEAVGTFIHTATEVENFALKKDVIFSRTQGYITKYSIVSQSEGKEGYTVKIRATVSMDSIKNDLMAMKILLESMAHPKIMILINETYVNMDNLGMEIAGTELSSLMGAKGFELVDKAQLGAVQNNDKEQLALAGNTAAAASLGLHFGAQYVIMGKAVAQDAGEAIPGSGIRSIQASIQLQVIQSQTASILGSVVKNGVKAHISPLTGATNALQDVARKVADEYLVERITDSFQDYLNNGTPLKLSITGVKSFRQYKDITKKIEVVDRVAFSKKEGWNRTGGILSLALKFKGTSEELADLLDGLKINNMKLLVVDFAPERVNCILE